MPKILAYLCLLVKRFIYVIYVQYQEYFIPHTFIPIQPITELIKINEIIGGKTLVHCVSGMSRSVSMCIAYLIKYKKEDFGNMGAKQARTFIKEKREFVKPKRGLMLQLRQFENQCNEALDDHKFTGDYKKLTDEEKIEQQEAIESTQKIMGLLKLQPPCDIR